MTYEQLAKANSEIKTTDIRGKEYATVAERINAFRKVYPDGKIDTHFTKLEDGLCVITARVWNDEGNLLATGTAYEKEGSSNINRTSFIENCETSAVGRALGMAGFGLIGAVATADEINRAQAALDEQKTEDIRKQKIGPIRAVALRRMLSKEEISEAAIFSLYKVSDLADLTEAQHKNINEHLKEIKEMMQ